MGRKQLERIYDYNGKLIKKQCGKCRKIKSIEEFHKSKSSKDGFYCQCKECSTPSTSFFLTHYTKYILLILSYSRQKVLLFTAFSSLP